SQTSANILGLNAATATSPDIFAYARPSASLTLVSVNTAGTGSGDSSSFNPVVSGDGRYVAFESLANDLTTNTFTNIHNQGVEGMNVFVRDLQTGATTLVSINRTHTRNGNSESRMPSISADGRMIAFQSRSTDLVPNFLQNHPADEISLGVNFDIYLYDQQTGTVSLVSNDYRNPAGSSNGNSGFPVISADGRSVIFQSGASNLDPRP